MIPFPHASAVHCTTDVSVGGIYALEHRSTGKIDDFHPEHRFHFVHNRPDRIAAAIDTAFS